MNGVTQQSLAASLPEGVYDRLVASLSSVPTVAAYVFGSYARGEQGPESDVDLYVVTKDGDGLRGLDNAMTVRQQLIRFPMSVDVISSHESEFAQLSRCRNTLERTVSSEGVKIHG